MRAVVISLRHKNFGQTIQITVLGLVWIDILLRGRDAVFFQHDDQHLGVDDRAGVEKLHVKNLTTDGHE